MRWISAAIICALLMPIDTVLIKKKKRYYGSPPVRVRGFWKNDSTYVAPHWRSRPSPNPLKLKRSR